MWPVVKCVLTVSHPSQICSILCLYKKTNISTMLHTVTEMFWMKSDACATKSREKQYKPKSQNAPLWKLVPNHYGYLYFWDCGQPSRQSRPQVGVPSRRPPTQTRQSAAGYVHTTQSGTQRWRSATYGPPVTHTPAVITTVALRHVPRVLF